MNSRYIPILGTVSVSSSNNTMNLGNQHDSVLTSAMRSTKKGTPGSLHYSVSLAIRITFERWLAVRLWRTESVFRDDPVSS